MARKAGFLNKKIAEKQPQQIMEQYTIFVESAQEISRRRDTANQFYLALNTAIITISGYLMQSSNIAGLFVPVFGMLVCYYWRKIIEQYKNLNTGKFRVIDEFEKYLATKPYQYEWGLLEEGKTAKYAPITHIERTIPLVFITLYLIIEVYFLVELSGVINFVAALL